MKSKRGKVTTRRNGKPVAVRVAPKAAAKSKPAAPINRKGGRSCLVCAHPDRAELDRGLVNGSMKAGEVARRVDCSRPSVARHIKNHLIKEVQNAVKADTTADHVGDVNLGAEIRTMYCKVKDILAASEKERNWKAVKAFHTEVRGYLELLGKFLGKIHDGPTVNIILSPTWVQVRGVILAALEPFPEARAATAQALIDHETANRTTSPGVGNADHQ